MSMFWKRTVTSLGVQGFLSPKEKVPTLQVRKHSINFVEIFSIIWVFLQSWQINIKLFLSFCKKYCVRHMACVATRSGIKDTEVSLCPIQSSGPTGSFCVGKMKGRPLTPLLELSCSVARRSDWGHTELLPGLNVIDTWRRLLSQVWTNVPRAVHLWGDHPRHMLMLGRY